MKIDTKDVLNLHPNIREEVLKLMEKVEKIDKGTFYPKIQSAVIAELMAKIYNDDTDLIINYKKRNENGK